MRSKNRVQTESMLKAKAMLTTPSVYRWLASSDKTSYMAGIYRRSCNLLNGKGRFLTLALPEVGPGPFTMVIELENPGNTDLRKLIDSKSRIIVGKKSLAVGQLMIRIDQANNWNSQPDWNNFNNVVDISWLGTVRQFILSNAPASSFAFLLNNNDIGPYYREAMAGWQLLEQGLDEWNITQTLKGVNRLAGLGIGLTPAGDDFLLGVIYALWMNLTPPEAKAWSANIHRLAASRTTRLSAYWLEVASEGQASKPWHDFLEAIDKMNDVRIRQTVSSLISYGHTSGFDALVGFILASTKLLKTSSEFN